MNAALIVIIIFVSIFLVGVYVAIGLIVASAADMLEYTAMFLLIWPVCLILLAIKQLVEFIWREILR